MKFAVIADVHIGDDCTWKGEKRKLGRKALHALEQVLGDIARQESVSFIVQLGDLIEDHSAPCDLQNMKAGLGRFHGVPRPVYHLVGNHEQINLSASTLEGLFGYPRLYYSFDADGYHFVVLFCRSRKHVDSHVDREQLLWLERELNNATSPVFVFSHDAICEHDYRENVWFCDAPPEWFLINREAVRSILLSSPKFIGAFNGHLHWNKVVYHDRRPFISIQSISEDPEGRGEPCSAYALVNLEPGKIDVEIRGADAARWQIATGESQGSMGDASTQ